MDRRYKRDVEPQGWLDPSDYGPDDPMPGSAMGIARSEQMTINEMIDAIEQVICIRKIWRCNAGWGMAFVLTEEQKQLLLPETTRRYYEESATFTYYETLEQCVEQEYAAHVLGEKRKHQHEPREADDAATVGAAD